MQRARQLPAAQRGRQAGHQPRGERRYRPPRRAAAEGPLRCGAAGRRLERGGRAAGRKVRAGRASHLRSGAERVPGSGPDPECVMLTLPYLATGGTEEPA